MSRPFESDKGVDWVSAGMALVTSLAIVSALWVRFGPGSARGPEHPGVGSSLTALALRDLDTSEPRVIVLGGPSGRVVWATFWSADNPSASADLAALEPAWAKLRSRARFTMTVAAVESDDPELVRGVVAEKKTTLPVSLALPATRRSLGAEGGVLPLHVLIDENGRVAAVASGNDAASLERLTEQAERRLDDLEPLGRSRFARAGPSHSVF